MSAKKEKSGFAKRFQKARQNKGMTTKELAEKIGVDKRTVEGWEGIKKGEENSKSLLAVNLSKSAIVLDEFEDYLIFGDEPAEQYSLEIKEELKNLTIDDIRKYHDKELTGKRSRLILTDELIEEITRCWCEKGLSCYRSYVDNTIRRYEQNRPAEKPAKSDDK